MSGCCFLTSTVSTDVKSKLKVSVDPFLVCFVNHMILRFTSGATPTGLVIASITILIVWKKRHYDLSSQVQRL